ncbi:DUF4350 domain-containing protein [Pirellulaceae bacterium SH449]
MSILQFFAIRRSVTRARLIHAFAGIRLLLSYFICGLLLLPGSLSEAQVFDTNDENWVYRYDIFQAFLQRDGLSPTTSIADALNAPTESTIVLMGDVQRSRIQTWINLKDFVESGGRLLIAPDNFHSSVYFGTVQPGPALATEQESMFSGFEDCIKVNRFRLNHPLVTGLKELITNRTGAITSMGITGDWLQLAFLPDDCEPSLYSGKALIGIGETDTVGAIVLLADPSVVSNGMFSFADNGEFTGRLANYLSEGNRRLLYFAIDNRPLAAIPGIGIPKSRRQNIDLPDGDDTPPIPPDPQFQTLLEVANSALQELTSPQAINSQLKDQPRYFNKRQYAATIIACLAILFVVWLVSRLLSRTTSWVTLRRPHAVATVETMLLNGHPKDVRNRIASETLAREFCRSWTGGAKVSEWRQWLDDLRHVDRDSLPTRDRVTLESILAIAVFGGKTPMPDDELSKLSQQICDMLQRYRQNDTLSPASSSQVVADDRQHALAPQRIKPKSN